MRLAAPVPPEWIEVPLEVESNLDGYRLDRFLKARIVRLSRERIQAIIARGQVRSACGRVITRASARVRVGQRLILLRPAPSEPDVVLDYREVYRDEALLVLDKPAGLPVHPSARYHRHTLTALMRERLGAGHGWEMAHRLDRETSGVMVFGRRRERPGRGAVASGGVLKRAFQERSVEKTYLAIVRGHITEPCLIDRPIGRALGSAIQVKMAVLPEARGGLPARTEVQPLRCVERLGEPLSLLRCRPLTGRQHQIRVHLASCGAPVLGDKLYGVDDAAFLAVMENGRPIAELEAQVGFWRHALHAARIVLPHPGTGAQVVFEAPWPEELEALVPLGQSQSQSQG